MTETMTRLEQAQNMLDQIDNFGENLTEWEVDFVDDLLKQTDQGRCPTDRQMGIIKRISKEKV